eukprot:11207393-Heterocapsa_arctica.AAC.1
MLSKDFPKPKGLVSEAGSAEQDAKVLRFRRLRQLLNQWPTSQLVDGVLHPSPLEHHGRSILRALK